MVWHDSKRMGRTNGERKGGGKVSWLIKGLKKLREEIRRLWRKITAKPELYIIVEYTKYYKYTNPERPSRQRYLEARAKIWLEKGKDPEKEWDKVESIIDDAMTEKGFDPAFFSKTKDGFEIIGEKILKAPPEITEVTIIDKRRGYVWNVEVE
jgi:hypothetical protein